MISKVRNKEEMAGSDALERSVHGKGTSPTPQPTSDHQSPMLLGTSLTGAEAWTGWG